MFCRNSNPREEGVALLNLLPKCQSSPLLVSSTPFNLLKKIFMPTYLSRCSGTVNEMVMFSYLAFKVMGFSMKHWQEWLHVKKVLELRAAFCHFVEVGPVLACNIHGKKGYWLICQLVLQVEGIRVDFSPEHVESAEKNSMSTHRKLKSLLINFTPGSLRCFSGCWPLPSTDTSSRDLQNGKRLT